MKSTTKRPAGSEPRKLSDRKRQANAANAKKSTGPRTPEGKARSSRNAVQHGMLARHVLPTDRPDEDYREYAELLWRLLGTAETADPLEHLLLERLASAHWRLARAWRFESECVAADRRADRDDASSPLVLPSGHDFDRLIRYETMIEREIARTTRQLHQLRARHSAPVPRETVDPTTELINRLAAVTNLATHCHPEAPSSDDPNQPEAPARVSPFHPEAPPTPAPAPLRTTDHRRGSITDHEQRTTDNQPLTTHNTQPTPANKKTQNEPTGARPAPPRDHPAATRSVFSRTIRPPRSLASPQEGTCMPTDDSRAIGATRADHPAAAGRTTLRERCPISDSRFQIPNDLRFKRGEIGPGAGFIS